MLLLIGARITFMFQSPGLHPPEYPVEDSSVNHPSVHTQDAVAGRSDVPDRIELFPHPRLLQIVLVLSYIKPFLLKKKKKYCVKLPQRVLLSRYLATKISDASYVITKSRWSRKTTLEEYFIHKFIHKSPQKNPFDVVLTGKAVRPNW